jgi:DNA polymerase IV (DinB-like DNA polymerase)
LDAFYASVEERENPELKGKPVIVGADPKNGAGRGVVSTCNYSAREFGVKSAMPISKAWRLCPEGVYLRPNFELYEKVSEKTMEISRKYADKFEQVGIDEAFLDITNKVKDCEEAMKLANKMKRGVFDKEKLTCSVGIGPNKLIAKLASDYKKPYGLTAVKPEDVINFLSPLPVRRLIGVGPKTEIKLKEMGVKTIGDLARYNKETLIKTFGKWGAEMRELANGIDNSEVVEEHEIKSVGREVTFEEDVGDSEVIFTTIDRLVDDFHGELTDSGTKFKTVNIKIRYEDFETHTRAKSLQFHTDDRQKIKGIAKELILKFLQSKKKIRLIGVRVSGLRFGGKQKTLVGEF